MMLQCSREQLLLNLRNFFPLRLVRTPELAPIYALAGLFLDISQSFTVFLTLDLFL